jgi:agmatine deiminase
VPIKEQRGKNKTMNSIALHQKLRMPAEWEQHASTWLSYPINIDTWTVEDGKYEAMLHAYTEIISTLSQYELVNINLADEAIQAIAIEKLKALGKANFKNILFHPHLTNDAWCRDHGPIFVKNEAGEKMILGWEYNAWGGKYPPFDADNQIPNKIAALKKLPILEPGIVLEGGSIEVNGKGTLLTTSSCLLHKNRNPHLTQTEIEAYLKAYLGVSHILWLGDGIVGDDTDGHIDDIARFVNETTLVTVLEENPADENYHILQENLATLQTFKDQDGNAFKIVTLPMPAAVVTDGTRLPASYANFLIANGVVLVPIFKDPNDSRALAILQNLFPDRKVVGIDCRDVVWGLGTIHCLTQQEPL